MRPNFASSAAPHVQELLQAAAHAREHAMPDVTGFKVGAAVRALDGSIYEGANSELVTGHFGHAEVAALSAGRGRGHQRFTEAAVVAQGDSLITPCGSCRDWLNRHLAPSAEIHCYNLANRQGRTFTVGELLPHAPRLQELANEAALLQSGT